MPFATLENPVIPKLGEYIKAELGNSPAVKNWNEGSFEKMFHGHGNQSDGDSKEQDKAPKFIKAVNNVKQLNRISNFVMGSKKGKDVKKITRVKKTKS